MKYRSRICQIGFRALRILLIILLAIISFLLTAIVSLAVCLLIWPQFFINDKSVNYILPWLLKKYIPAQFEIKHSPLKVNVDTLSFLKRRLDVKVSRLCISSTSQKWSGCLQDTELSVTVGFFHSIPRISKILQVPQLPQIIDGKISSRGNGRLADGSRFDLKVFANWDGPYDLVVHYTKKAAGASLHSAGIANESRITGEISAIGTGWVPGVSRLSLRGCNFFFGLHSEEEKIGLPYGLQLDCPTQLKLAELALKKAGLPEGMQSSPVLAGVLSAELFSPRLLPLLDSQLKGALSLSLATTGDLPFTGSTELSIEGRGSLSELSLKDEQNSAIKSKLKLSMTIPDFKHWVELFSKSRWAVPAPFNVLEGQAQIDLNGSADLQRADFQVSAGTRLHSRRQVMDWDGNGTLKIDRSLGNWIPNLNLDVLLKNVKLELPYLEFTTNIPRFLPDDRIQREPKRKELLPVSKSKASLPFNYQILIHTLPSNPVLILSNLAQAPIPVRINLEMSNRPMKGIVRVEQFPVEVFRHKAMIEYFTLDFRSPVKESPIDGLLRVDLTDYQLIVKVNSILDKPQVSLTSEPPLTENQIIASLLFGQPLEELNSDETSSVGSTRAAIADGALNLLSLYVLASTPIQSVGYDPSTGVFSAKLRLGEGTSLNLGTDAKESTSLGIRKRLGPFWSLATEVSRSPESGEVASAYLEWSHRY